jgi:hypothetical protein
MNFMEKQLENWRHHAILMVILFYLATRAIRYVADEKLIKNV